MNLINDILLRTGILTRVAYHGQERIEWFKNITFVDLLTSLILPILIGVIVAFCLKKRYDRKKAKDQLTLRDFYNDDENEDIGFAPY